MSKPFPTRLIVLAAIALLFGLGSGAIIVITSRSATQPNGLPMPVASGNSQQIEKGKPAPDFTLNTLDGKPVSLKDFRGKKVLVNFWASWCGPCKQESPDLQSAYAQLRSGGNVAFIGIGLQDKTQNLKSFVESNKLEYTILEDGDGTVGDAYRIMAMPVSIFINSDGLIHKVSLGAVTKDDIIKTFEEMK